MSNINKMLKAASESNPAAFQKAFQAEMNQRAFDAIDLKRTEVLSKMIGGLSEEEEVELDSDKTEE